MSVRLQCLNCQHFFDEEEAYIIRERHGMPGHYAEVFICCPTCRNDNVIEATENEEDDDDAE